MPPWLLLPLLLAVCAAIVGLVGYLRTRHYSTAELLARLPADDALIVSIDLAALRGAGVLQMFESSEVIQEPEYRAFKAGSGFDYLRDLDWALASVGPRGAYFILRGRFNWGSLAGYVTGQGGACYNSFCRVSGSTADRKISFFPLQPNLMALAVDKDEYAASRLSGRNSGTRPRVLPSQPVWLFIPAGRLRGTEALPSSARLFTQALGASDSVLLAAAQRDGQLEVLLEVACRSEQEASRLVSQLREITGLLTEAMARENRPPAPGDLSGVLTAGVFESKDRTVYGRWPLERGFLEALAGGTP